MSRCSGGVKVGARERPEKYMKLNNFYKTVLEKAAWNTWTNGSWRILTSSVEGGIFADTALNLFWSLRCR